jgi:hypothetical protein
MIGSLIVLLLIVAFVALKPDIIKAYEDSAKKIHLEEIQTSEQEVDAEILKEKWLADFSKLFNESGKWNASK